MNFKVKFNWNKRKISCIKTIDNISNNYKRDKKAKEAEKLKNIYIEANSKGIIFIPKAGKENLKKRVI